MAYNFGDSVSLPGFGAELPELLEAGRPSSVLCRLGRDGFTGLLYVEHSERTVIFTLVQGVVTFAEDPDQEGVFSEELFQRGLITSRQFTDVMEVVNETLADNEDQAFCSVAVERGVLTAKQVKTEMSRRVRALVIQAMGWSGCRMDVDDDAVPSGDAASYPQQLGPLLYMSVRTFYEDDEVRALLGDLDSVYIRFAGTAQDAIDFFAFDHAERRLLDRFDPEVAVARTIEAGGGDPLEAWQMLCMLKLAEMAEFGTAPFSPAPEPERSGVRSTRHSPGGGSYSAGGVEERVFVPRGPRPRQPAAAPPQGQPRAEPASPSPTNGPRFGAAVHAAKEPPRAERVAAAPSPAAAEATNTREDSSPSSKPRRPVRKVNRHLKRLDDVLRTRAVSMPAAASSAKPSPVQERSHVKQLLIRRRMRAQQMSQDMQRAEKSAASFKDVQALLRGHKFKLAREKMADLCKQDPDNETYEIYLLWATFRANNGLPEEETGRLRTLLRERLNDDQYAGFAYYALGMLALPAGKERYAEKCFRKSLSIDAKNKDAERHLRLIEVRRKAAAQAQPQKIFGIEIGGKKS